MRYNCPACKTLLEQDENESDTNFNFRVLIHQNEHIMHSVFLVATNTRTGLDKSGWEPR